MTAGQNIAAFPVLPSGKYLGNDGNWSTFSVSVGTPSSQTFHTLISTSSRGIWLIDTTACNVNLDSTVQQHPDCQQQRGSAGTSGWNPTASSTWSRLGQYILELNAGFALGSIFGKSPIAYMYPTSRYDQNVTLGQDTVALSSNNKDENAIAANDSLVYAISDPAFFVGTLGIGDGAKRTETSSTPFSSILDILANQSFIPSKSWGYTAGAFYNQSLGSLVLGGYDAYRIHSPTYDFGMSTVAGGSGDQELVVTIQDISIKYPDSHIISTTASTSTSTTFNAIIDSSLPYLYLPQSVCDNFAHQLGLTFDTNTTLYILNETQRLQNQALTISIIVSDTRSLQTRKEIIFPYSAFDLYASWPIYDNPVPYFPIRRAANTSGTVNILGRAFLQYAYLIANFENNTFVLGDAVAPTDGRQLIYSIPKAGDTLSPSKKLARGTIAGITLGALISLSLALTAIFLYLRRLNQKRQEQQEQSTYSAVPKRDTGELVEGDEKTNRDTLISTSTEPSEIDGTARQHLSELSTNSNSMYHNSRIAEAVGDEGAQRFELPEAKEDDIEGWERNLERLQRTTYELPGETPLGWVRPREEAVSGSGGTSPSVTTPGGSAGEGSNRIQPRTMSMSIPRRPVPRNQDT